MGHQQGGYLLQCLGQTIFERSHTQTRAEAIHNFLPLQLIYLGSEASIGNKLDLAFSQ